MRPLILITCAVILCACGATKSSTSDAYKASKEDIYKKSVQEYYESKYREKFSELRDSLALMAAHKEKSQNKGLMDSYLFTALAHSRAWIDGEGLLNHTIENKDSIPTKYIIDRQYFYETDTLLIKKIDTVFIHKTDTVFVRVHELTERKPSFWDRLDTFLDYVIAAMVVICIILLYVGYRKFKS